MGTGEGPFVDRVETTGCHRDGHQFPIEISITRVPGVDPPMFTGFVRDLTARAQAERERDARVILGESETMIAQRFADAGLVYRENPMALHLRGMNMLYETMRQNPGSVVIIPSSAVESMALGGISGLTALAGELEQGHSPGASTGGTTSTGGATGPGGGI